MKKIKFKQMHSILTLNNKWYLIETFNIQSIIDLRYENNNNEKTTFLPPTFESYLITIIILIMDLLSPIGPNEVRFPSFEIPIPKQTKEIYYNKRIPKTKKFV